MNHTNKMLRLTGTLFMPAGQNGYEIVRVQQGMYHFISIVNNTPNTIKVYEGAHFTTSPNASNLAGEIPVYTALTIPINQGNAFTFIWLDGGGVDAKQARYTFSEDNLGINSQLGSTSNMNVALQTDSVGLARQAQLPTVLLNDNLKVSLQADGVGLARQAQLPTVLLNDNLKVSLQADSVGLARQAQLPTVLLNDNLKVTVQETKSAVSAKVINAGDTTVKATAGSVFALSAKTGDLTVRDGANALFFVPAGQSISFQTPLKCSTSIVANLSVAGEGYVQYE